MNPLAYQTSQLSTLLTTDPDTQLVKRRGRRGPGVPIIPGRIRQARTERGLSLAELAGTEVSRAFIHQLEQGLARPSLQILEMIAQRTGKPLSFFTSGPEPQPATGADLPSDLVMTSKRLERMVSTMDLTDANREGLRMVIAGLRHGARLLAAILRELDRSRPDQPQNGQGPGSTPGTTH